MGLGGLACGGNQGRAAERPNILLVIGDDMTWSDCEPYGSPDVKTPNMARLAAEGVCFDAMFTGTAMCAPTRQQLYSGLHPVRSGAYPNHCWSYDGVRSLPHHLGALGYRVGLTGKRHFGPDECYPFETVGELNDEPAPGGFGAVAEFVNRDAGQPYCLVVASHQPHVAWDQGDPSAYPPDKLTVPPYLIDCPYTRECLSRYYAEITYLDAQLGAALDVVEQSGRGENTMVIFTSEQGQQFPFGKWTCYDTGLRTAFIARWPGKVKPGSRLSAMTQYVDVVPTLVEAAGGAPDRIDTGCPDANGKTGFDGRSFLAALLGQTDTHADCVFGVQTTRGIINGSDCYPIRSARSRRYKYIRNLSPEADFSSVLSDPKRDGHALQWWKWAREHREVMDRVRFFSRRPAEELYDLEADPYELTNIAGQPAVAAAQADLRERLDAWMAQQGDYGIGTEIKALERQAGYLRAHPDRNFRTA